MFLTIEQYSISAETARKVLEELPFLTEFQFMYANKRIITMKVENLFETPKLFKVSVNRKEQLVGDTNAAIQFVTGLQKEPEE